MSAACQLSVVGCQLLGIRVFGCVGHNWANRFEIAVQFGAQFVKKWLKSFDLVCFEHSASIRSTQEMLSLVQRTARSANETPVVGKAASANSFGNISSNAICSPNELQPNRFFLERFPTGYQIPNLIRYFLRKLINPKFLKISPHASKVGKPETPSQLATDNGQPTTDK
jgi:hypothetical protein